MVRQFEIAIDDGVAVTHVYLTGETPTTAQTLIDAMVAGTGLTAIHQDTTIRAAPAQAAGQSVQP